MEVEIEERAVSEKIEAESRLSNHNFNPLRLAGLATSEVENKGFSGATVRIRFLLGEVPDKFDAVRVIL